MAILCNSQQVVNSRLSDQGRGMSYTSFSFLFFSHIQAELYFSACPNHTAVPTSKPENNRCCQAHTLDRHRADTHLRARKSWFPWNAIITLMKQNIASETQRACTHVPSRFNSSFTLIDLSTDPSPTRVCRKPEKTCSMVFCSHPALCRPPLLTGMGHGHRVIYLTHKGYWGALLISYRPPANYPSSSLTSLCHQHTRRSSGVHVSCFVLLLK